MSLKWWACIRVKGVRGKKEAAPTHCASEHAGTGQGDASPGFRNKLEGEVDGQRVDFQVGFAIDSAAMVSREGGVLVREEVTDGIMGIL